MSTLPQFSPVNCPFCHTQLPDPHPGKSTCPSCHAEFEIDDRGECVFVDPTKLRLPIKGTVCSVCGLVQGEGRGQCGYCGAVMSGALQ
jgi:hypothetical protein